ncbi:leader peptidase (prepilin peptidase)/N-methyltransferase [Bradyrhizobium sp. USDA 4369]
MTSAIDNLCIAALLVTCAGLIWTDLRSGLLPDWMNAIIAISGLVRMAAGDDPSSALWEGAAALAVGIVLLLLRRLYAMVRDRQGLGLGDVKFLMAATLWTGLSGLPILLLVATMTALAGVLILFVMGRRLTGHTALPFGPFLVIGLLAVLALQAIGSDLVLPA